MLWASQDVLGHPRATVCCSAGQSTSLSGRRGPGDTLGKAGPGRPSQHVGPAPRAEVSQGWSHSLLPRPPQSLQLT